MLIIIKFWNVIKQNMNKNLGLFIVGMIIIAISLIATGVVWAKGNDFAFVLWSGAIFFGVQMAYDGIKSLIFPD